MARSKATTDLPDVPEEETQRLANTIEDARLKNYQIPPLSRSNPGLDMSRSYAISAAIRSLRCERDNDTIVGRKIGFTNRSIWPEYNVDRSNWSYMYRSSVVDLSECSPPHEQPFTCDLTDFSRLEPKIEPEIVLGLRSEINSGMTDEQLLNGIGWIAHGFEIVISIFPGWKFTAVDTTAAFALHGKLLLGRKTHLPLSGSSPEDFLRRLESFQIRLFRNGSLADEGVGSNVLGSPIDALRHLAELLEADPVNSPLQANEMVTTGTLTKALNIQDRDRWRTEIEGLDVAPVDVAFTIKG